MDFGDYLKDKRRKKEWSQRDLASASGVSNAEISRLEAGRRKEPSATVIRKLAQALNTPTEEFLQHVGLLDYYSTPDTYLTVSESNLPYDSSPSYIDVSNLTDDEIQKINEYILFLKSQRK